VNSTDELIVEQLQRKVSELEARVSALESTRPAAPVFSFPGPAAPMVDLTEKAKLGPVVIPDLGPDPQTEDGFEIFLWKGFKFYRCNRKWESGDVCAYATQEKDELIRHIGQPHTRNGKAAEKAKRVVSPILGPEGEQIIREIPTEQIPEEHRRAEFKK